MSYDYGNARVAAMRGRLLQRADLLRLGEAPDAFALLAALARFADWTAILRTVAPLGAEPGAAVDAAIDRHRGERLGLLPTLYEGRPRRLVEGLVMGLDLERVLAVLRHRRAGETSESVGATIVRGALLDAEALGALARAPRPVDAVRALAAAGVVEAADVPASVRAAGDAARPDILESALVAAFDRSRAHRAQGPGADAAVVRDVLERERRERAAVAAELRVNGALAASLAERTLALARFDALTRRARRDPLGILDVAAYVAALEVQAIRLRAVLARVRADWSGDALGRYLAGSGAMR